MSSRALKKLSLQTESDILKIEEDNDVDDLSSCNNSKKKFNRYDLIIILKNFAPSFQEIRNTFTFSSLRS